MKTVLIDNSLCAYPLSDSANPDLIYNYICALKDTGVRYIELDFRTLMKLHHLPEGLGYIFRIVDPMFMQLTDYFDFSYVLATYSDLQKGIKTDVPIMLETPYVHGNMGKTLRLLKKSTDGNIAALRLRSDFDYCTPEDIVREYKKICSDVTPLPVDICALNTHKTALDAALKFTAAQADSLTLTAGLPAKYCSLEEYFFALMTLFDSLPDGFDIHSLGKVSVYRQRIFQTGEQALPKLLDTLDNDIRCLTNADTGEKVNMRLSLKDTEYLRQTFVSALEKMAESEEIPKDCFDVINEAIKYYDRGIYNDEMLRKIKTGLLN